MSSDASWWLITLLVAYVALIWFILSLVSKEQQKHTASIDMSRDDNSAKKDNTVPTDGGQVTSLDILGWEFEYARVTASEAIRDRHLIMNFFIIIAGSATTGIIAYSKASTDSEPIIAVIALWLVSAIGVFYFLMLVKLRQAWYDSMLAMNAIKNFCINNNGVIKSEKLATAFKWKQETIPEPNKPWNVFFYSAAFTAFLTVVAFSSGGVILILDAPAPPGKEPLFFVLSVASMALFAIFIRFYFSLLNPKSYQYYDSYKSQSCSSNN